MPALQTFRCFLIIIIIIRQRMHRHQTICRAILKPHKCAKTGHGHNHAINDFAESGFK